MFHHHTKTKGDLGILKAKLDLFEQGFLILNPETEHAPFDLVIYQSGHYKSVQVKYRSLNRRGALEVVFRNTYCNSQGIVKKEVDKANIDVYALYCPETDKVYYFDPKNHNKSITLRVDMPRNRQNLNINFAENFRRVP